MKIIYRVYNEWSPEQRKILEKFGIVVGAGYDRIDIEQNEMTKNKKLLAQIDKWGLTKFFWTDYDVDDYKKSSLFVYISTWVNGYPMRDDDNSYKKTTYNLDDYCEKCGLGMKQKGPFFLKKVPKWGKKPMFELGWIYDEIFVRKEFYDIFFRKMGVESREVLLYKKETVIEDTVQLILPTTNLKLQLQEHEFEICNNCKRKKFLPQAKGFFPSYEYEIPDYEIFKSNEYFGNGAEGYKRIFITKKVLEALNEMKIRPNIWPCSPTSPSM